MAEEDERARYLPRDQAHLRADRASSSRTPREQGYVPLVLGGDHSVALGTLGGLASVHGPGGVLWIDAHGDLNTPETSPSGNVHGMVLAAALGSRRPGFRARGLAAARVDPDARRADRRARARRRGAPAPA